MENRREIAVAKRCQLLCGSGDRIQTSCPCRNPSECQLTSERRRELASHPDVVKTMSINFKTLDEECDLDDRSGETTEADQGEKTR